MKKATFKIIAAFFVFTLIGGYAPGGLSAQSGAFSFGRIVYIDPERCFVVIDLGKSDGIKMGSSFDVYRQDEKVGEIRAIKLRRSFSACDIECTYRDVLLQVGDRVEFSKKSAPDYRYRRGELMHQKIDGFLKQAQAYLDNQEYGRVEEKVCQVLRLAPGHSGALHMLSKVREAALDDRLDELFAQARTHLKEMEYELAKETIGRALQLDPKNEQALKILGRIEGFLSKIAGMEPEIVAIDIDAPKHVIHAACLDIFKRYGCIVSFSDPVEYNLEASKYIEPAYARKFFTEWGPVTRNKIYYSVEIKQSPKSQRRFLNRLSICLVGAYDREGRIYNYKTKSDFPSYKEAEEMVVRIKNLAEEM